MAGRKDRPEHIRVQDVPPLTVPFQPVGQATPQSEPGSPFRMHRVVSKESHGGDLLFGTTWFAPGFEIGPYTNGDGGEPSYGPADYVYYVISGRLRIEFSRDGEEPVTVDVGSDEAIYLARDWTYRMSNPFEEPLYYAYAMTPAEV
jgi:mannose-6-phosphate isomerase-like protein (cupin superfamily)